jgi:hypothetical protein
MMKTRRVSIDDWPNMAGMGPAAWNRDHRVLAMHTSHHEQDHQKKHFDDGKQATNHTDEKEPDKEE